jgi:hypothetical protein
MSQSRSLMEADTTVVENGKDRANGEALRFTPLRSRVMLSRSTPNHQRNDREVSSLDLLRRPST